jgi:hypothetical protein
MFESSEEMTKEISDVYSETSRIIVGFIFATVLLVGGAWFLIPKVDLSITEQTIFWLWIGIVVLLVIVVGLQKYFLSPKRLREFAKVNGFSNLLSELKIKTTMLGIFSVLIAIMGFLISVMGGNAIEMFRTAAIVFVVFMVIFPRIQIWKKIINYAMDFTR